MFTLPATGLPAEQTDPDIILFVSGDVAPLQLNDEPLHKVLFLEYWHALGLPAPKHAQVPVEHLEADVLYWHAPAPLQLFAEHAPLGQSLLGSVLLKAFWQIPALHCWHVPMQSELFLHCTHAAPTQYGIETSHVVIYPQVPDTLHNPLFWT